MDEELKSAIECQDENDEPDVREPEVIDHGDSE